MSSDFGTFSVLLSRGELGLDYLDINDQTNFIVSDQFLGAGQVWLRQTVRSPFVDGEFTVNRALGTAHQPLGVQVLGADQVQLKENIGALVAALSQFRFQMKVTIDEAVTVYQCETADYAVDGTRFRWMARKALVMAQVPIWPREVTGA